MLKRILSCVIILMFTSWVSGQENHVPTIDELIGLKTIGSVQISPDGQRVVYSITQTDFEKDQYITQLWMVDVKTGESIQLTRGEKSAFNFKWSPDGKYLTFVSGREDDKNQIFAIRPTGGEAMRLTDVESGISNYKWSIDGKRIAFTTREPESKALKARKKYAGNFSVVRREYRFTHLWVLNVDDALHEPAKGKPLTVGHDYTVTDFSWSPDGSTIAFTTRLNPDRIHGHTADIYTITLADSNVKKLVDLAGPDSNPQWSPDGNSIVFSTYMGRERYYPYNSELAIIPATGGEIEVLTEQFDEHPRFVKWNRDGIYFSASQKTATHLFHMNPSSKTIKRISQPENLMAGSFNLTKDGKTIAFTAYTSTTMREVYISDIKKFKSRQLTQSSKQIENFTLGTREVISWKSKDDTKIEGVLVKPKDFDPGKRYPLLCVIHGGPTGIDRPYFRGNRYYPVDRWVARGALILRVNYRGSAGYGEAFRTLNMRNLGVGDAWDVLSGVDYLIDQGWVDAEKVGCMGWSQGGYISAFLTTSSDRFAAISVGAGISNWATYYYNTDITPFCIHYLGDDPADDPAIYEKTSPMTHILRASTPTLIQHGEFDLRVPIPNGYELRQGLVDRGVPVEMVVYKGFGHGINKPKSQRAVMWHNETWFNHYLWGDALIPLWEMDIPKDDKEEEKE